MAKLGGVILASLFIANLAIADQVSLLKCGSLLKVQEEQVMTNQTFWFRMARSQM
jgi:hypothetical protein